MRETRELRRGTMKCYEHHIEQLWVSRYCGKRGDLSQSVYFVGAITVEADILLTRPELKN